MKKKHTEKKLDKIFTWIRTHHILILLLMLFGVHVFFRVYQFEYRLQFNWDQVDNAWNAKNIIVEHKYPLLGMQAKQNSGINLGPGYYYLTALFYYFTDLDPIAAGYLATFASIFTFFVLFYVVRKMFSPYVALIAVFIHAISFYVITFDRTQWPVNFIAPISLLIFYFLYKILNGEVKYLLLLGCALGFSFHIHLTSVFFVVLVFLCLPLFPKKKEVLYYGLGGFLIMILWMLPNIISLLLTKTNSQNYSYIANTYHGIHLRRIMQLTNDAFIEFDPLLKIPFSNILKFFFLPVFIVLYIRETVFSKKRFYLLYLTVLWTLVPWFILSLYRGDITDYYFSSTRLVAVMIISYLLWKLFMVKGVITKIICILLLAMYAYINMNLYFTTKYQGMKFYKEKVVQELKEGKGNQFLYGAPESYLHYYYKREQQKKDEK